MADLSRLGAAGTPQPAGDLPPARPCWDTGPGEHSAHFWHTAGQRYFCPGVHTEPYLDDLLRNVPEGERYTAAQLYARLLREPPEQAQQRLANLQESADAGWMCQVMDHAGAVLMCRRLTRELVERAEREATYVITYNDHELVLTHEPCGADLGTTFPMGIAHHRGSIELSDPPKLVELSAAVASHRCPEAEEAPCATTAPSS